MLVEDDPYWLCLRLIFIGLLLLEVDLIGEQVELNP